MNLTQEYLKIFLFSGIISGTAITILFSGGQYDTTKFDFESVITAEQTNDMVYFTYFLYNTGNTDITSVTVDVDCCTSSPVNPVSYPIVPRNTTGSISSMLQFDGDVLDSGDDMLVTFVVQDNLGNEKTVIEPVRLD